MWGYDFSARIVSNYTYLIIGKRPLPWKNSCPLKKRISYYTGYVYLLLHLYIHLLVWNTFSQWQKWRQRATHTANTTMFLIFGVQFRFGAYLNGIVPPPTPILTTLGSLSLNFSNHSTRGRRTSWRWMTDEQSSKIKSTSSCSWLKTQRLARRQSRMLFFAQKADMVATWEEKKTLTWKRVNHISNVMALHIRESWADWFTDWCLRHDWSIDCYRLTRSIYLCLSTCYKIWGEGL